jgi:acyl carrier protein
MEAHFMLTESNTKPKIRDFVHGYFIKDSGLELEDDTSFLEEGIIDSTGVMELVAFIEVTFGIEIKDEEIIPDNFDSVNKLVDFIRSKSENKMQMLA